jgi:hypothetical protein
VKEMEEGCRAETPMRAVDSLNYVRELAHRLSRDAPDVARRLREAARASWDFAREPLPRIGSRARGS